MKIIKTYISLDRKEFTTKRECLKADKQWKCKHKNSQPLDSGGKKSYTPTGFFEMTSLPRFKCKSCKKVYCVA